MATINLLAFDKGVEFARLIFNGAEERICDKEGSVESLKWPAWP